MFVTLLQDMDPLNNYTTTKDRRQLDIIRLGYPVCLCSILCGGRLVWMIETRTLVITGRYFEGEDSTSSKFIHSA